MKEKIKALIKIVIFDEKDENVAWFFILYSNVFMSKHLRSQIRRREVVVHDIPWYQPLIPYIEYRVFDLAVDWCIKKYPIQLSIYYL